MARGATALFTEAAVARGATAAAMALESSLVCTVEASLTWRAPMAVAWLDRAALIVASAELMEDSSALVASCVATSLATARGATAAAS